MSLFVIGDKDTVLGFGLVGIEGEAVQSADEARAVLDQVLTQGDRQIILITRQWADQMGPKLNQLKMTTLKPVVVEIPGSEPEPTGRSLRELVEEAIGIRLR